MNLLRVLLAIILPPLAVLDRGCGSILIVLLLTAFGWIPGVIAALIILNKTPTTPIQIVMPDGTIIQQQPLPNSSTPYISTGPSKHLPIILGIGILFIVVTLVLIFLTLPPL